MGHVKTILRIGAAAVGLLSFGCAHDPPGPPKPNPCIGSYEARKTMPCWCPGTLDPTCAPWILDAKEKQKEPTK